MFTWNPQMIRFLKDASEYGRFNDVLAQRIAPYLLRNAHVCDAGCGLGYLSLALSPYCNRVTAVDTSREALGVLRENIAKNGVTNIDVVEGDVFSMQPQEKYDAMVFCFFGRVGETLQTSRAQCRGKTFLFKKNWKTHRFSLDHKPLGNYTYEKTVGELRTLRVPFFCETFGLEMGQPLRSLEDAAAFFGTYSREESAPEIPPEAFKNQLLVNPSVEFPYFLPSSRQVGMIVLDAGTLPDSIDYKKGENET